jgi:GNAT superfamily N-acetyltransferase
MNSASEPVIERCSWADIPSDEEDVFGWRTDLFETWRYRLDWATPEWRFLVRIDERPVVHLAALRRAVTVAGRSETVGGLSRLVTVPQTRSRGLATLALNHAARFLAEELGLAFAMGFCIERLVPFYLERGWQPIQGQVMIEQSRGKRPSPCTCVVLPLGRRPWPQGDIDVGGLPW